jgi:hypothetical protein
MGGRDEVRDPRERALRGTVQFAAGNNAHGFGQDPSMNTVFDVAYELRSSDWMEFTGAAGWEQGTPAASLRTAWNRNTEVDGKSTLSVTVRQLFLPGEFWAKNTLEEPNGQRIQSVTMSYEQERKITDRITLQYGSLWDRMQLAGQTHRWSPYGRITILPTESTHLVISYAAVSPRVLPFDWDPLQHHMEQWLAIPQVSTGENGQTVQEGGRHIEARWEQRLGSQFHFEGAIFHDSLSEVGVSLAAVDSDEITSGMLRDPFSDRYFVSGGAAASPGGRVAVLANLSDDMEVAVGYSYGANLQAPAEELLIQSAQALRELIHSARAHSVVVKVNTQVPWTHTRMRTSYRWLPRNAVAVVDPYDRGIGQSNPYLNLFVLQPIPSPEVLPGRFEAVADFSNLLAQGYLTIQTPNGGKGFVFPVARSFRGGFNFTF